MAKTLFERLCAQPGNPGRATPHESTALRASVRRNLEHLLSSRAGLSAACPSYGLPDLAQFGPSVLPQRAHELQNALRRCIEGFEPRITNVSVEFIYDQKKPLTASFLIHGVLAVGPGSEAIWFHTVVGRSGRIRVSS